MKALILEAQRGNMTALCRLSDELGDRVRSIAARYTRVTAEDFDDLLQEAWAGLLEALPEVKVTIGQPEEYLLKRARWRVLDYLKWQRRRYCDRLDAAETTDTGDEPAAEAVSSASVRELFGRLTNTQQRVALLLLDGMTWREAADELGCASSNVAYHVKVIRRAYVDLHDEYEPCLAA
jgi:RNA polymerase sigma-70 factor (ECF subfamily)